MICAACRHNLRTWMETPVGKLCLACCVRRFETTRDCRLLPAVLICVPRYYITRAGLGALAEEMRL